MFFQPQMLTLTVSGMFKELKTGHKVPPLRFFFKTLVIVPAGSGFCICNEEVHISNATPDQSEVSRYSSLRFIGSRSFVHTKDVLDKSYDYSKILLFFYYRRHSKLLS